MKNITQEDLEEKKVDSTSETAEKVETEVETEFETKVETEQDPLKTELERVQKVSKYTEKEKAEHTLKSTAKRLEELGGDPTDILGIKREEIESDDDKPLTIGAYRKIQKASAIKTATDLAEEIQNETERELVKYHLDNTIKSTGIPSEDLKLARALVNAVKNTQVIEEINRKTVAKTHSNGSGVDAKQETEVKGDLTPDEMKFMGKPFNMTKEAILKLRKAKK